MNIERFDNRLFSYNITIGDNKGNKTILTTNVIENLTIIDNIFFPFPTGSIAINNVKDALQASLDKKTAIDFAGNNRDILCIDIMPNVTGSLEQDVQNADLRKTFNIGLICILNELQDSDEPAAFTNKMNFRVAHHQMALENSATVSSDQIVAKSEENLIDLNNSERSVKTGELLKQIILQTYQIEDEESIIDAENFDLGSKKIKWYARGDASAHQSMMYINGIHLSEQNNDPCLFFYDYSIGKFKHIAISKLFELQKNKPKEYVLETFYIGSGQAGGNDPSNNAGQGLNKLSNIIEHKLTPINGDVFARNITNNVFCTTAPGDRNFYFGCKNASIKQVLKDYKELYVDPLKNVSQGEIVPSVSLEDIQDFINLRPKITTSVMPINHEDTTRNNMLMNLLVCSGDNIVFRTLGSTHRKSGHFIDIATEADISDTGVANNILGRWFVISVHHIFAGNNYYNIIEAVKTYKTVPQA